MRKSKLRVITESVVYSWIKDFMLKPCNVIIVHDNFCLSDISIGFYDDYITIPQQSMNNLQPNGILRHTRGNLKRFPLYVINAIKYIIIITSVVFIPLGVFCLLAFAAPLQMFFLGIGLLVLVWLLGIYAAHLI